MPITMETVVEKWDSKILYTIISKGVLKSEAQDVKNSLYLNMVEKNFCGKYDENRGAFSTYLYTYVNNYVKNYTKLTAAETDQIIEDIILLSTSQDKLIARYYNKIKKQISINAAAQFYQIEWYLQSQVRTNILESIPMINELEKKSK